MRRGRKGRKNALSELNIVADVEKSKIWPG